MATHSVAVLLVCAATLTWLPRCSLALQPIPQGCSVNGTELVSCTSFVNDGRSALYLGNTGITNIRRGAFDGLTAVQLV